MSGRVSVENLVALAKWLYATRLGHVICNATLSLILVVVLGYIALTMHHYVQWLEAQKASPFQVTVFSVVEHLIELAEAVVLVASVFIHSWQYLEALARGKGPQG